MKVYRHQPKGGRFFVLFAFSAALVTLSVYILAGTEALPVKAFALLISLAWLGVTVDSVTAKVEIDEQGVSIVSMMCKKFVRWKAITDVRFGEKWVLGSYMPEHIIVSYRSDSEDKIACVSLYNDINDWKGLLKEIATYAPSRAIKGKLKSQLELLKTPK